LAPCTVNQAHGIARSIVFQADGAARLLEKVQILDEFRQLAGVALVFPLLDKFGEAF